MRNSGPTQDKPWWYREDDLPDFLKNMLIGVLSISLGLGLLVWFGVEISFADPWVSGLSIVMIFFGVSGILCLLAGLIAALALYRQWRDKKLGRYTEFHE